VEILSVIGQCVAETVVPKAKQTFCHLNFMGSKLALFFSLTILL